MASCNPVWVTIMDHGLWHPATLYGFELWINGYAIQKLCIGDTWDLDAINRVATNTLPNERELMVYHWLGTPQPCKGIKVNSKFNLINFSQLFFISFSQKYFTSFLFDCSFFVICVLMLPCLRKRSGLRQGSITCVTVAWLTMLKDSFSVVHSITAAT